MEATAPRRTDGRGSSLISISRNLTVGMPVREAWGMVAIDLVQEQFVENDDFKRFVGDMVFRLASVQHEQGRPQAPS